MKTSNIFRTVFMAVLLLMGVSNVMADKNLYTPTETPGEYDYIIIPVDEFKDCKGDILSVTYETVPYAWGPSYGLNIGGEFVGITVADCNVAEKGVYEITLDDELYEKIMGSSQFFIQAQVVKIYSIDIVSAGVSYNISLAAMKNGTISAPSSAKAGAIVTLTPKPNDGYKLDWMNVRDADGGNVTVTKNQFIMPDKDVTVYAEFVEKVTHVTASISNAGYATFWSEYALDFSQVDGDDLKAYYAKSANDTTVVLERVTGTVAEETGLILVGSTTDIPVVDDGYNYTGNLLRCAYSDTPVGAGCYVLTIENGVVKFASTANKSAEVPKYHAYLDFGSSARNYSRLAVVFAGESTGIEDRTLVGQEENVYYDLRGVRVAKPTHGIYVVNGKKVFVK